MMAVSLLSIAMKLVAARRGELTCFIEDISDPSNSSISPNQGRVGAEMFVVSSENCTAEVYKDSGAHRQNVPYLMFMMTLLILAIDVLSFRIRLFEQKIMRFHEMIVKRGVLTSGDAHQDCDDILSPMESPVFKESIKALAKERSRNELCDELKRSSILFYIFTAKNIVKIIVIVSFLVWDVGHGRLNLTDTPIGTCYHNHSEALSPTQKATCQEKFAFMFGMLMGIFMILLVMYATCSLGCLAFLLIRRPVSNFIRKINRLLKKKMRAGSLKDGEAQLINRKRFTTVETEMGREENVKISTGHDFIFLFDLLAHNYGLEAALKMMTYVDKDFFNLLATNVNVKDGDVGPHHISIEWSPAEMEHLCMEHNHALSHWSLRECKLKRDFGVDSYQITVMQMDEKLQSIIEIIKVHAMDAMKFDHDSGKYRLKLENLAGGTNKYVITVSSMVGETQMKGTSLQKVLCPYDPELPLDGMAQKIEMHSAEIKWVPPFGNFDRYLLTAESDEGMITKNVGNKEKSYTLVGLSPGTKYEVKLRSITGMKSDEEVRCMNPIKASFSTKPAEHQGKIKPKAASKQENVYENM